MSDITTLRTILFSTLTDLRDTKTTVDVERIKLINDTAKNIIDTAKVEVDFMRATGTKSETGFLCSAADKQSTTGTFPTANGTKTVSEVRPGVTLTTHRMNG